MATNTPSGAARNFGTSPVRGTFIALALGAVVACAPPTETPGGSGGAPASGGSPATGGASSGGAPATGGASSGGASASGGRSASGGAPSTGGSASGGANASGGAPGAGGRGGSTGSGGRDGTAGSSGSGGASNPGTVTPSAGCGKSGRPANGRITTTNEFITDFPTGYDGMKPFPLLMALHACGNANNQWENLTKGSVFETEYVRWLPNTTDSGQCWNNYNNNIARVLKQFDDLLANYCIDTNHVFAVGHSSGAQMLVNILSHKTDTEHLKIKGVSPVAADPYNVAEPMPVLYIDGKMDNQRSATSATNTVARFRTANSCMTTSMTYSAIMGCKSSEGPQVDPGCIIYDGCKVPTIWCSHNDPSYSGTQHGVPCFALKSMGEFFASLK